MRYNVLVLSLIMSTFSFWGLNVAQGGFEKLLYAQISKPFEGMEYLRPHPKPKQAFLELDAKSAMAVRLNTAGRQKTLFQKNPDESLPIASITKLMTALLVLENQDRYPPDSIIEISGLAAGQTDVPAFGNLKKGESYNVKQLLELMMRYSSNDAAYALAEVVGIDTFVETMNRRAEELGLGQTAYLNSNGLDLDDGGYNRSSARDLMELSKYILDTQPGIFALSMAVGPYMTQNGIFSVNLWDGQALMGGKTGYTQKAGGCMVVVFSDTKGNRYIDIIVGSASSESRIMEMQKLINATNNLSL